MSKNRNFFIRRLPGKGGKNKQSNGHGPKPAVSLHTSNRFPGRVQLVVGNQKRLFLKKNGTSLTISGIRASVDRNTVTVFDGSVILGAMSLQELSKNTRWEVRR